MDGSGYSAACNPVFSALSYDGPACNGGKHGSSSCGYRSKLCETCVYRELLKNYKNVS